MLECKQIDALMLDRLYDELPESSSSRRSFDQHVDDCVRCRAELDSLQRTREAIREIPDEEPPPALSAILLHEAARRAPGAPRAAAAGDEGGGLWAWLLAALRPLAAHPAATAVATLVLVAGVAGSLYVRGQHEVSEPRVASEAAAPSAAAALAGERAPIREAEYAAAEEAKEMANLAANGYRIEGEPADVGLLGAEGQGALDLALLDTKAVPLREDRRELDEQTKGDSKLARPSSTRSVAPRAKNGRAEEPLVANAVSGTDLLLDLDADAPAPARAFESGVAPQASPGAPPPSGARATAQTPARDENQPELAWAQAQHDRLAQAVKEEKCRDAARIANDILDRNPTYYRASVAGSKDVKSCQWYVADEQRRRAGARARRAAPAAPDKAAYEAADPAPAESK